jgi:hypothetical protein
VSEVGASTAPLMMCVAKREENGSRSYTAEAVGGYVSMNIFYGNVQ